MHARLTRFTGVASDRLEKIVERIHQEVPVLTQEPGYEGLLLLVDRDAGRVSALTLWGSMRELKATERAAAGAREVVDADTRSAEKVHVDRYEVVANTTPLSLV